MWTKPSSTLMALRVLQVAALTCETSANNVRVVGGGKPNQGRLQIYGLGAASGWKATCSQGFTEAEARVACRDMSYLYGGVLRSASDFGLYPPGAPGRLDSIATAQYNITCPGSNADHIRYCTVTNFDASRGETCGPAQQVGLECHEGKRVGRR